MFVLFLIQCKYIMPPLAATQIQFLDIFGYYLSKKHPMRHTKIMIITIYFQCLNLLRVFAYIRRLWHYGAVKKSWSVFSPESEKHGQPETILSSSGKLLKGLSCSHSISGLLRILLLAGKTSGASRITRLRPTTPRNPNFRKKGSLKNSALLQPLPWVWRCQDSEESKPT